MTGKYTPEFREQVVRVVSESDRTIASVATEYGVSHESLRTWVKKARAARGETVTPMGESTDARVARLEKENRELRMKVEFLGKATAFFAQEFR